MCYEQNGINKIYLWSNEKLVMSVHGCAKLGQRVRRTFESKLSDNSLWRNTFKIFMKKMERCLVYYG